jgi:four helix bundle protein
LQIDWQILQRRRTRCAKCADFAAERNLHRMPSMNQRAEAFKARTKKFALDVLAFTDSWPTGGSTAHVAYQLCKAATSVAANYRAACRGRSKAEFAAKIGTALEEADESLFWLEIADGRALGRVPERKRLTVEANELTAILVQSNRTVRANLGHAV